MSSTVAINLQLIIFQSLIHRYKSMLIEQLRYLMLFWAVLGVVIYTHSMTLVYCSLLL